MASLKDSLAGLGFDEAQQNGHLAALEQALASAALRRLQRHATGAKLRETVLILGRTTPLAYLTPVLASLAVSERVFIKAPRAYHPWLAALLKRVRALEVAALSDAAAASELLRAKLRGASVVYAHGSDTSCAAIAASAGHRRLVLHGSAASIATLRPSQGELTACAAALARDLSAEAGLGCMCPSLVVLRGDQARDAAAFRATLDRMLVRAAAPFGAPGAATTLWQRECLARGARLQRAGAYLYAYARGARLPPAPEAGGFALQLAGGDALQDVLPLHQQVKVLSCWPFPDTELPTPRQTGLRLCPLGQAQRTLADGFDAGWALTLRLRTAAQGR